MDMVKHLIDNIVMNKIYYKHIIIKSGDQDDVEKEINSYIEDAKRAEEKN